MGKSSSGRHRAGSETSSRPERRRDSARDSTTSSRRKSSRRDDNAAADDNTTVASSRTAPSTYVTAFTAEPLPIEEQQGRSGKYNERDRTYDEVRGSRKDDRSSKYGSVREDASSSADDRNKSRRDGERSRRDSRKSGRSDRKDRTRAFGDHDASLPQNQFPGEMPSTYTQPFRPTGQAADYYGDQGESVAFQPGVRPNQPSIVTSADQAHLMEPTIEARPPAEPSSLGQTGAAASYYSDGGDQSDSGVQYTPSKPSQGAATKPDRPPQHSSFGASPRTSPIPGAYSTQPSHQSSSGVRPFTVATVGTAASGAAATYYSGTTYQTPPRLPSASFPDSGPHSAPVGTGAVSSYSSAPLYGAAAVAGASAGAAYLAHHNHEHSHTHYQGPSGTSNPTGFSQGSTQMRHRHQHQHRSPLGKFVDWFRDPKAVAEYEEYTEAIGVCKYCFDPMSSPADAPRRHHYRPRRTSSGSRYGSTTRVDKTYRYSSDEERKRRSATKKVVVGGLAGYGAAKVGDAILKANHNFDDTYSIKSGRPVNPSRVSFQEQESKYARRSSRYSSTEDLRSTHGRFRESTSSKSGRRDDRRATQRRDSSSSSSSRGISRGAAISAGVGAAGLAMGAAALNNKLRRNSRSRSRSPPRKSYYSKRVSPMHSYVDLSMTNSGPSGIVGFFTSPSANKKKGKKAKGFFNFTNASSSSSDADLAFGAGTVRRKSSSRRISETYDKSKRYDSTAGMMGLVKMGNDLASESDRRRAKGKSRNDANYKSGHDSRRLGNHKILMSDQVEAANGGRDDEWEDMDDSDNGLAYGSGGSATQSRDSLVPDRRYSQQQHGHGRIGEPPPDQTPDRSGHSAATYIQSVEGQGESRRMGYDQLSARKPAAKYSAEPPPMQELEPRPLSDPRSYDLLSNPRQNRESYDQQPFQVSSTSVPLQQPQPVVPVTPFINNPTFTAPDQEVRTHDYRRNKPILEDIDSRGRTEMNRTQPGLSFDRDSSGNYKPKRPRRDSSPAKLPSRDSRNNVSFSLTDEQLEVEQKDRDRDKKQLNKMDTKNRRRSADAALVLGAGALAAGVLAQAEGSSKRDSSETARDVSYSPNGREAEIDRQLRALYDEQRRNEERKRALKDLEGGRQAAPADKVNIVKSEEKRSSSSEDTSGLRRKSSLKKSKPREASPQPDTQQERIARMAAQRVKSTPSPVYEDYSSFFVPQEIQEHLQEHNEKAEHRDDIGATVVEIVPGGPKPKSKRQNPFDPDNYRQFGLDPDDDPLLHPWPVPRLELIEPTPPGSRAHSERGDVSPIARPSSAEPTSDIGEPLERRVSTGSKVTWGDHDTYVYEVQTPEYERSDYIPDHEVHKPIEDKPREDNQRDVSYHDRSTDSRPSIGSVWTLDDSEADKLERELPPISDRPHTSRPSTIADPEPERIRHPLEADDSFTSEAQNPQVIEIKPKDSVDYSAPLATGHVQSIPRETSESTRVDGPTLSSYQSPFAETVSDLGMIDGHEDATSTPSGKKLRNQSEIQNMVHEPETSPPDVRLSKSERRRLERASSSSENGRSRSQESNDNRSQVPDTESVFDYLVDDGGKSMPTASILGLGASAILAADETVKPTNRPTPNRDDKAIEHSGKLRRSSTLDDSQFQAGQSSSKAGYQSDPEDWERSHGSEKPKKSKRSAQSDVGSSDKRSNTFKDPSVRDDVAFTTPRRSHTESEVADDLDTRSTGSGRRRKSRRNDPHAAFDLEDSASRQGSKDDDKPRRKSKRDSQIFDNDDDSRSVASSPADLEKRSKDKDKKSSGGFFSNIFSSNKSDVSTSSKKSSKSAKSEGRADRERDERSETRKKRRSRDRDFDDIASATSEPIRKSRRSSDPSDKGADQTPVSRDQSLDDGFVSAEESTEIPAQPAGDDETFLGKRPEMPLPTDIGMPMDIDGVSGPASERKPSLVSTVVESFPNADQKPLLDQDTRVDNPLRKSFSSGNDTEVGAKQIGPKRRLSAIRTDQSPSSPTTPGYPTAIPVHFRLPASSPTVPRFSMSSPVASPSSPLTTPRTRQGRPKSTEFAGKNIRPLYLVEVSNFAKATSPDTTEYPPLPASNTSSSHGSMEDLRAEAEAQEQSEYFIPSRMSPEMVRDQARRQSYSYWHDGENRRQSPDYLDSRSATPVPGEAQRARDSAKKPKPKYEFHSPSELLQDPSLLYDVPHVDEEFRPASPLPSVVSTDLDQDYMSARSRSLSPDRSRSISRGRRSASRSRSTSVSWQDAVSTASLGGLAGSALGLAARGVLHDSPAEDQGDQEVVTPTETVFPARDVASAREYGDTGNIVAPIRQEDVPPARDEFDSQSRDFIHSEYAVAASSNETTRLDLSSSKGEHEVPLAAEAMQDSTVEDVLATNPINEASSTGKSNERLDLTIPSAGTTPSDVGLDTEEPTAFAVKTKKKGRKEKKTKKQTTLAFDDNLLQASSEPPSQVSSSVGFDTSNTPTSKDAYADTQPQMLDPETSDAIIHVAAAIPGTRDPQDHKGIPLDYFENSQKLHEDIANPGLSQFNDPSPEAFSKRVEGISLSVTGESSTAALDRRAVPSSTGDGTQGPSSGLTPFEQAFEAAVQARGLSEGATLETAYEAFLPEASHVLEEHTGTPLTTIEEENEATTPALEDLSFVAEAEPPFERRNSKKSKRKDKKTSKDDSVSEASLQGEHELRAEETPPLPESASEHGETGQTAKAQAIEPADNVSVSTPNPFGDNFEISRKENDVSGDTDRVTSDLLPTRKTGPGQIASNQLIETSEHKREEDEWSMPASKKGRKDRKDKKNKKSQALSWEDDTSRLEDVKASVGFSGISKLNRGEGALEQSRIAEEDTRHDSYVLEESAQEQPEAQESHADLAHDLSEIITPVQVPQQEIEDPWETGTKRTKKSKKNKRKSLTWADEVNPGVDEKVRLATPMSEAALSTIGNIQVSDPTEEKTVLFPDQLVEEPLEDENEQQMAPEPETSTVAVAGEETQADVPLNKELEQSIEQASPVVPEHSVVEVTKEAVVGDSDEAYPTKSSKKDKKKQKKRTSEKVAVAAGTVGATALSETIASSPDNIKDNPMEKEEATPAAEAPPPMTALDEEAAEEVRETIRSAVLRDIVDERPQLPSSTPDGVYPTNDNETMAYAKNIEPIKREGQQLVEPQVPAEDVIINQSHAALESATTAVREEVDDIFHTTSKKSRRDKKKRRQSTFDDFEGEAGKQLDEKAVFDPRRVEAEVSHNTEEDFSTKSASLPLQTIETEPSKAEDDSDSFGFAVKSKKSKKDKKKQRQSTFHDLGVPSEDILAATKPGSIAMTEQASSMPSVQPDGTTENVREVIGDVNDNFSAPIKNSETGEQEKPQSALQTEVFEQSTVLGAESDIQADPTPAEPNIFKPVDYTASTFDNSTVETPIEEAPVVEFDPVETTIAETPASDTSVADVPIDGARAVEFPLVESVTVESLNQAPVVETPAEIPALKAPQAELPTVEPSVPEEPILGTSGDIPRSVEGSAGASAEPTSPVNEPKTYETPLKDSEQETFVVAGARAGPVGVEQTIVKQQEGEHSQGQILADDVSPIVPADLGDAAEDDWGFSRKKSTKEKKKKRQSTQNDFITEPEIHADDLGETSRGLGPQLEQPSPLRDRELANSEEPTVVVPDQSEPAIEEAWALPSKKSKKDKKKKRQSALVSPADELDVQAIDPTKTGDLQVEPAETSKDDTFQAPSIEEDSAALITRSEVVPADDWGFSAKQSKKDKKKKRQSALVSPLPESDKVWLERKASATDSLPVAGGENVTSKTTESLGKPSEVSAAGEFNLNADEQQAGENEDDLWPSKSKKLKKDKRKQQTTLDSLVPEQELDVSAQISASDATGISGKQIHDNASVKSTEDVVTTRFSEEPSRAMDETLFQEIKDDDIWTAKPKKSKRDKKKKQSTLANDFSGPETPFDALTAADKDVVPASEIPLPEFSSAADSSLQDDNQDNVPEASRVSGEQELNDEFIFASKKLDKDKKRQSKSDESSQVDIAPKPVDHQGSFTSVADQDAVDGETDLQHSKVSDHVESLEMLPTQEAVNRVDEAQAKDTTITRQHDPAWVDLATSKSYDTAVSSTDIRDSIEQDALVLASAQDTLELENVAIGPTVLTDKQSAVAEEADDAWAFSSKKSKKDKKKNRKIAAEPTFDSSNLIAEDEKHGRHSVTTLAETHTVAGGNPAVPEKQAPLDAEQPTVEPVVEEEWGFTTKSKKDKKKNRKSVVEADLAAPTPLDKPEELISQPQVSLDQEQGAIAEDEWAPTRKSKKDKKKKHQSPFDEASIEENATLAPVQDETSLNDTITKAQNDDIIAAESSAVAAFDDAQEVPMEAAVDEDWTSTKKSKKDKREERLSTYDNTLEDPSIAFPTNTPEISYDDTHDRTSKDITENSLVCAVADAEQEASAVEPVRDDWEPSKKSKKDKKKKRFTDVELRTTEYPGDALVKESIALDAEATTAGSSHGKIAEDVLVVADKLKENKSQSSDDPEAAEQDTAGPILQRPAETRDPTEVAEQQTGLYLADTETATSADDNVVKIDSGGMATEKLDMSMPVSDIDKPLERTPKEVDVDGPADDFAVAPKKSKKDKKKNRPSTLDDTFTVSTEPVEPEQEFQRATQAGNEEATVEPEHQVTVVDPEEEFASSSKKSKKDKKKKHQPTIDNASTSSSMEPIVPYMQHVEATAQAQTEEATAQPEQQFQVAEPEEEFVSSSKRSKKDKKKKRQSTFDDTFTAPPEATVSLPRNIEAGAQSQTIDLPVEVGPESQNQEPEDDFVISSRKSKKDKKKKRQSVYEDAFVDAEETAAGEPDSTRTVHEPEKILSSDSTQQPIDITKQQIVHETERSLIVESLEPAISEHDKGDSTITTEHEQGPPLQELGHHVSVHDRPPEETAGASDSVTSIAERGFDTPGFLAVPPAPEPVEDESMKGTSMPTWEALGQPQSEIELSTETMKDIHVDELPNDTKSLHALRVATITENKETTENAVFGQQVLAGSEWTFSSKKSKKDKKKKRQSAIEESLFEPKQDDLVTTAKDLSSGEPEHPAVRPEPTVVAPEVELESITEPSLQSTVGQPLSDGESTRIAPPTEAEWDFSVKKPKKDKKKKRLSTYGEMVGEASQSEPVVAAPGDSSSAKSVLGLGPQRGENNQPPDESQPVDTPAAVGRSLTIDPEVDYNEEHQQDLDRWYTDAPSTGNVVLDGESTADAPVPDSRGDYATKAAVTSAVAAISAIVWEADPSTSSKRSKKDKKKKRQSTSDNNVSEPPELVTPVFEEPKSGGDRGTLARDVVEDDGRPTFEDEPADEWSFSSKKAKKTKKKSKLADLVDEADQSGSGTPRSTDEFDTAVQTPQEQPGTPRVIDSEPQTFDSPTLPAGNPPEDYFAPVGRKKSKKEKKKKTSLAWADSDDQILAESQALGSQQKLEVERPQDSTPGTQHQIPELGGLPRTMDLDQLPQDPTPPAPQLLEEHNSDRDASFVAEHIDLSISRPDATVAEEDYAQTNEEPFAIQTPVPAEAESAKREKSSKGKKERRIFEFNGTESIEAPAHIPEQTEPLPADAPMYIEESALDDSKRQADKYLPDDSENVSDVSESTRERRKRRRSPRAWTGEEPEDLLRDRSMTPPPEHDDLMDTALGVAAGLGFGANQDEPARAARPRSSSPARRHSTGWSFAQLGPSADLSHTDINRDSGVQFTSPTFTSDQFSSTRDSGFVSGPADRSKGGEHGLEMSLRPPRPQSPTSSTEDVSKTRSGKSQKDDTMPLETPRRKPSPIESTSKERSSVLFNSSPAMPTPLTTKGGPISPEPVSSPLRRSPSIHGHHHSREELKQKARSGHDTQTNDPLASNLIDRSAKVEVHRDSFSPPPPRETIDRTFSPNRMSLNTIREDVADSEMISRDHHPFSNPPISLTPRERDPNDHLKDVGLAAAVGAAGLTALALSQTATRDSEVSHAKSLGRSKSRTSSLRNLRANAISPHDSVNAAAGPSQVSFNDNDLGSPATRDRDMADTYDGYGSYPGSPRSPTRPPSVRRRQSMQQIKDLETRLDQLASENRTLAEAKLVAEQQLEAAHFEHNRSENTIEETLRANTAELQERDAEILRLKQQVASLIATHETLQREHEQSLANIQTEHDSRQSQWEDSSRELETLRSRHAELSQGMESIVRHEIDTALVEKNAEIQRLRQDLDIAREKIRDLQSQILAQGTDNVVTVRDEDYFDTACQQLCQQVQGWVLRFSKYSDTRVCRSTNEVRDEKIVDRFDNAILDGSDVDVYLADRVKRRDVFMSVVMTMIWEYVFTRYLFGMDRDQRQKLKQLEKNLSEVGPASAVHQWRALTLTLLSKRESFKAQRASDAEAVSLEIFSTLSRFLPPPQNLEAQIVGTLRNVMHTAVNLSIEMRTQRAEYIMLPPLQPEYDTNGDLARKVYFNASLMNERSGETTSNDELERNQAVVRMVLFPLVVKKGDDTGIGEEEIVVCPAQVLIARPDKGKKPRGSTRVASGDSRSLRAVSTHSLAMSGIDMNENMI